MGTFYKSGLTPDEGRLLAEELELLPWHEVQAKWNEKSGETISRQRVRQIALRAEEKLREELIGFLD